MLLAQGLPAGEELPRRWQGLVRQAELSRGRGGDGRCLPPTPSCPPAGGCPVAQGWPEDLLQGSGTAGGLRGQGNRGAWWLVQCYRAVPAPPNQLFNVNTAKGCRRAPPGEGCQKRGAGALPAHKLTSACSEDRKRPGAALGCFSLLPLGLQRPVGYGS